MKMKMASLWLLALLPVNALIALDLSNGIVRPGAWVARTLPVALVLAVIAWAELSSAAMAIRLRKEFRLVWMQGVMLLIASGCGLLNDASVSSGVVHVLPPVLLTVLPTAALLALLGAEVEDNTLHGLMLSPLGGRALVEKWGVGALLVVVSWLQISPSLERDELWWFVGAAHVLPLATLMTWFMIVRVQAVALGITLLVPMVLVTPFALFNSPPFAVGTLALYSLAMLAVLPRVMRRGLAAPSLEELVPNGDTSVLWRKLPPFWFAELTSQRDALFFAVASWVGFAAIRTVDVEAPTMVLFIGSALAAALSIASSFAEALRAGTLEPLLAMQPRARVFRSKIIASLSVVGVISVVLPLAMLRVTGLTVDVLGWLLAIAFVWCVSLAVSVHVRGAGTGLGGAVLAVLGLSVLHVVVHALPLFVVGEAAGQQYLTATFALTMAGSAVLAWWRFVRMPASPARALTVALGATLFQGAAMSVAGVTARLIS